MSERIYLYDSTLRDGAQTAGVDFSATDKHAIALQLDTLGIDYIEGGWPGANPTDDAFFSNLPSLSTAKMTAFGMTRKANTSAGNDPGLNTLLRSKVKQVCIVGKSWDFHVEEALNISQEENLAMISESILFLTQKGVEVFFDAEHFFDGYKNNPKFALECILAAYQSGARWIVLCDTNGGTLPNEIYRIIQAVTAHIPGTSLGIHCHNDTDQAVANSLAAVQAGVRHIQGTINGLGERCGNANLTSIIPTLMLKMGFTTGVTQENLTQLTHISRFLDDRLNRQPHIYAPYVGASAFAHKGGLHVSAIAKNPVSYEHIDPALVGNERQIVVSDQAGRSNILARLKKMGITLDSQDFRISQLVDTIKQQESEGYAYDTADASFELLVHKTLGNVPSYFTLQAFRVMDERRNDSTSQPTLISEATIKVKVEGRLIMSVAEGNGPVNALDKALRKALSRKYPSLKSVKLVDYKVRILNSGQGTEALTRVLIESQEPSGKRWTTIGISTNIINASYQALLDSITYKLLKDKVNTEL